MNYMSIKKIDTANGPGVRTSLFVAGCHLHCKGCFNQSSWDFSAGTPFTKESEDLLIQYCSLSYIRGLSILGGNPTEPENEKVLVQFLQRFRRECPDKDVWMWTGHVLEDLVAKQDPLVPLCDVIVDGPFIEEKKDLTLPWRGSSNQRVINVREFLEKQVIKANRSLEMALAG